MNTEGRKTCLRRARLRLSAMPRRAVTLLELIVAMAMITIIFAAILPQFALVRSSWDSKQGIAEAIQNGRVLIDHINRNLSKALRITAVSESSVTNGYIQFIANDSNTYRYDIGANNYVEYGPIGNLADLAGPVSLLKFTCYDACDLDNPLSPVYDTNDIRVVKVDAVFTNLAATGQNRTFSTWVYLRTNSNNGGLVGCWKLDETSGTTAADSSGNGNNGTLVNMTPASDWVEGYLYGGLDFDGSNDYVDCGNGASLNITSNITVSAWVKTRDCGDNQHNPYVAKGDMAYSLQQGWNNYVEFFIYDGGWYNASYLVNSSFNNVWHHLAGTYNGSQVKLYVDGVLRATNNHTGSIATNAYNVNLGRNAENATQFYNGVLDDVRIYNRALSADEIANLTNILRYRDFNEAKAGPYSPVITISRPSTTNAGDLLIAAVATDGDTSNVIAPPEGWTLIDRGAYDGAVTLGVWWKIAGASEPASYQFTWWGSSKDAYGWMMRFTGHNPTNPINASSSSGTTSATPISPPVTTTVKDCLILRLGAFKGDDIVVDSPGLPGHTAITMDESHSTEVSVTYGGYASAKLASDGSSITISKPAGTSQGDYLVAAVAADGTGSSMGWATPSGWGLVLATTPYTPALGIWYKTAGASEPASYTFTWTASEQAYGWIMRFTGYTPTLVGFQPYWETSSTPTCQSVTPSGPFGGNILILRLGAFDDDAITVGNPGLPSDHNAITMDESNSGSGSCSGGAGYKHVPAGSPSGTTNFTLTASKAYMTASIPIWSGAYNGTCSGGAGYVRQSAAGSSGTSTFTLGSANEARMLTIAITPANDCADCSGDRLRP